MFDSNHYQSSHCTKFLRSLILRHNTFPGTTLVLFSYFKGVASVAFALLAAIMFNPAAAQSVAKLDSGITATMDCAALVKTDFTHIPGAPTSILESTIIDGHNPPVCAVKGVIQPNIQFEIRLPLNDWNGRYFQTGCGGFCGQIRISHCSDMLANGFVVGAHNMGHVGHFIKDPVWGSDAAARVDYGGRSTHLMSVVAKAVATRFYEKSPAKSYYRGCSTGGREGLTLAQRYPEDFDGIVAGDPAFAGRLGAIANNWDAKFLLRDDGSEVFDKPALSVLHQAVLQACDAIDGVKDGILMDPRQCDFDPASIQCDDDTRTGCLSAEQVHTAKMLYQGPFNSKGIALMPGATPYGSEPSWSGAGRRTLAEGYLRYLAFETNPPADYNYRSFNFDTDIAKVEKSAKMYDPVAPYEDPDLSAFASRGGKLIVYHGWADAGVSPMAMLDYYARVTHNQGGLDAVQNWFRVFMVPGMFHCRGGNAPNTFDFMPHIIEWAEKGSAPQSVLATQSENNTVVRTRPLYPYPSYAEYKGKGDVNSAENWHKAKPTSVPDDRRSWIWEAK